MYGIHFFLSRAPRCDRCYVLLITEGWSMEYKVVYMLAHDACLVCVCVCFCWRRYLWTAPRSDYLLNWYAASITGWVLYQLQSTKAGSGLRLTTPSSVWIGYSFNLWHEPQHLLVQVVKTNLVAFRVLASLSLCSNDLFALRRIAVGRLPNTT